MNMQRVGEPQPITELNLEKPFEEWIVYGPTGEVKFREVVVIDQPFEYIRRHVGVGDLLIVWQDGRAFVGTLHMSSTLKPLSVGV